MIVDLHMHSDTSSDSDMTIREAYDEAVAKGIKNICITNHHEPMEVKRGEIKQSLTDEKIQKYREEVAELQKDGKVNILFGVEISYTEEEEGEIREFLNTHDFDFVLGSIHYVNGMHILSRKYLDELNAADPLDICNEYLRLLKKAIKTHLFDVMSHMDTYKKLITPPPFEKLKDQWEEVANLLRENGVGFEINTGPSQKKPGMIYPSKEIIQILIDRGVKIITIGSDSHHHKDIGRGIEDAENMLKDMGVKDVYLFEKRKPKPLPL